MPPEKRGPDEPVTPSPPSSHKRVRSSGTISEYNASDYGSPDIGPSPETPERLPPLLDYDFSSPERDPAFEQPPPNRGPSFALQRARAQSDAYPLSNTGLNPLSFTPVYTTARETGFTVGGSSRFMPEEMTMGGIPLKSVGLGLPLGLGDQATRDRARDLERELDFQGRFPPCLPPSDVPELAPKSSSLVLLSIPEDASETERHVIESRNNDIAEINKANDRKRNNQAAKKSRELRIESLTRTKAMLIDTTAELNWCRMRLITSGDNAALAIWEDMRRKGLTQRLTDEIRTRVEAVEFDREQEKKRRDSIARVTLNKERARARAASDQRLSKDREASRDVDSLNKSEPKSTTDALQHPDPQPSRPPSRALTYGQSQHSTPQQQSAGQAQSTPGLTHSHLSAGSGTPGSGPVRGPDPFTSTPIYSEDSADLSYIESPSVAEHRRQIQMQLQTQMQTQSLGAMGSVNMPFGGPITAVADHQSQQQALAQPAPELLTSLMPPAFGMGSSSAHPGQQTQLAAATMQPNGGVNQQQSGQFQQQGQQYIPFTDQPPPYDAPFYPPSLPPPSYPHQYPEYPTHQSGSASFGDGQSSFTRDNAQQ